MIFFNLIIFVSNALNWTRGKNFSISSFFLSDRSLFWCELFVVLYWECGPSLMIVVKGAGFLITLEMEVKVFV